MILNHDVQVMQTQTCQTMTTVYVMYIIRYAYHTSASLTVDIRTPAAADENLLNSLVRSWK